MRKPLLIIFFISVLISANSYSLSHGISMLRKIGARQGQLREVLLIPTESEQDAVVDRSYNIDITVGSLGLKEISDEKFNAEVLSHHGLSVVLFSSHWCQPCRTMKQVVEAAKNSIVLSNENVKFLTIDTDENPLTASEFQLRSIPSTLIFKNGRVVADIIGLSSTSDVITVVAKHSLLNLPDIKVSSFE